MAKECVFCNIVAGKVPASILYQDDQVIAFRDINPQAPTHLLVIPKEHIPSLAELGAGQREIIAHLISVAKELAKREGVAEKGYRLVVNCGREGGQVVPHLHLHLLGGRQLSGIMG
jgi:histidine triad (HIT) family protein